MYSVAMLHSLTSNLSKYRFYPSVFFSPVLLGGAVGPLEAPGLLDGVLGFLGAAGLLDGEAGLLEVAGLLLPPRRLLPEGPRPLPEPRLGLPEFSRCGSGLLGLVPWFPVADVGPDAASEPGRESTTPTLSLFSTLPTPELPPLPRLPNPRPLPPRGGRPDPCGPVLRPIKIILSPFGA